MTRKGRALFACLLVLPWAVLAQAQTAIEAAQPTMTLHPWTTCTVSFTAPSGQQRPVSLRRVPVAQTVPQKIIGLNASVAGGRPMMLFTWAQPGVRAFWMKGTPIPLSIAFIGPHRRVLSIQRMQPNTTTQHRPPAAIVAALEVKTPTFKQAGVQVGDTVVTQACVRSTR